MVRPVSVLLLDDGELDDVQGILDDLGMAYGRVRGGAIARNTPAPTRLLISTPRRIDAVHMPKGGHAGSDGLTRIVVVNEDSTTLRAKLREIGFDYMVRRPVHPEALRLLILHCLYTGDERRGEPRVPVGFEVSFRTGLLPRRAALVDLSSRGCRLLSRFALEPGKRITLQIPHAIGSTEALTLRGRVIRMSLDEKLGPDGPTARVWSSRTFPPRRARSSNGCWKSAPRGRRCCIPLRTPTRRRRSSTPRFPRTWARACRSTSRST